MTDLQGLDRNRIYPTAELAKIGLQGHVLRQLYKAGLPRYQIGRKTFVRGDDLFRHLEKQHDQERHS